MSYTLCMFEDPAKSEENSVYLFHKVSFLEDDIQICFVSQLIVAGFKLGNQDGCKHNAHTEHKQPVDEPP